VVARDGGPTVLEITTAAYTLASDEYSVEDYGSAAPGQVITATLQPYDVLQVLSSSVSDCPSQVDCHMFLQCCYVPPEYDLSGTHIRVVSGPEPAVFGGNDCANVPYGTYACDHLEQQLFPVKTWGTHYVCAHNITQHPDEPTVWRVMSGSDGNGISFNPSVHSPVTLDRGEYIEFQSLADFTVTGSGRVAVAQFMVGQHYSGSVDPPDHGDPSMSLVVPQEQYRTEYTFLTPDTYVYNYLTVVHPVGEFPVLDGNNVMGDTVEIDGEYARTNLSINAGVHQIQSPNPFGIVVYGVGRFTSYMYPGGLDLRTIQVIVE
jgi:hypothetical protein